MIEIGRKEAVESRGFSILCMGIMEDVFHMEERMQSPGKICYKEENPCQSEEGALAWDRQLCLGQWQWRRRGWRQPQEIHQERRGAKGRVRLHRARGSAKLRKIALLRRAFG